MASERFEGRSCTAIRSYSPRFGVLGKYNVKFKDKVKNGSARKLPCLYVFETIWCVLFLVCGSEHRLTNLENIKFLISFCLLYYNMDTAPKFE